MLSNNNGNRTKKELLSEQRVAKPKYSAPGKSEHNSALISSIILNTADSARISAHDYICLLINIPTPISVPAISFLRMLPRIAAAVAVLASNLCGFARPLQAIQLQHHLSKHGRRHHVPRPSLKNRKGREMPASTAHAVFSAHSEIPTAKIFLNTSSSSTQMNLLN